jgi:peptidoglycan biosynthesis protein MviN/MurJ (putative lipid II flippase)
MNAGSHHRRIAIGFVWVSFFVLIGKLAGAAKEMAVAWRYGVGGTVDAYAFIFNLVNWPVAVWFSVLTVVLVPLVARVNRENPAELPRFASELLGMSIVAGVVLVLAMNLGLPLLFTHSSVALGPEGLSQARAMIGPLSALLPLGLAISVVSAWTMARGRHRNTLLEAVPSLILLAVLALPAGVVPAPLAWGSVLGCAVHALCLAWPLWRQGEIGRPVLAFKSPAWRYFWGGVGIMVAGQALTAFTPIVDQFFAGSLGAGAISVLSYATRLMTLILGLGAMAISRATLPIFSELSLGSDGSNVFRLATQWTRIMFVLGALGFAVAWVLAPWGVQVLFQRGAFDAGDTEKVATAFRYLGFQIPFYFASLVLIAHFSAMGKYRIVAFSGVANLVVKAVLLYLLVPSYGLAGVCMSTVLMYVISLLFFLILHRRLRAEHRS